MRPPSIVQFEKVYVAAILVGIVNGFLSWGAMNAMLEDPAVRASGLGTGFLIFSMLIGTVISLLLWYFIARRASNVAKWIYVVIVALGVWSTVSSLANPMMPKGLALIGGLIALLLQLYGAYLLFRPDAKEWLESRGARGTTDPSTFD